MGSRASVQGFGCRLVELSLSLFLREGGRERQRERGRGRKGRAEIDGCRLALPSLSSALLASLAHTSVKQRKRSKMRERGNEKGKGEGKDGDFSALPCLPLSLSPCFYNLFHRERKREREREMQTEGESEQKRQR